MRKSRFMSRIAEACKSLCCWRKRIVIRIKANRKNVAMLYSLREKGASLGKRRRLWLVAYSWMNVVKFSMFSCSLLASFSNLFFNFFDFFDFFDFFELFFVSPLFPSSLTVGPRIKNCFTSPK